MTRIEFARLVSQQAPDRLAWAADIWDGDRELLMPPPFHHFTVAGREYWWFLSSHHIRGTSCSMSGSGLLSIS